MRPRFKFLRKKIISGCEDGPYAGQPYLTRITVVECPLFAVYLHKFHRSDASDMHDHPWAFASFIVWRGYVEETARGRREIGFHGIKRKRIWPGSILFRRASHVHRVELVDGKPAYSVLVRGPYVREWGFHTSRGWQRFKEYFLERGC